MGNLFSCFGPKDATKPTPTNDPTAVKEVFLTTNLIGPENVGAHFDIIKALDVEEEMTDEMLLNEGYEYDFTYQDELTLQCTSVKCSFKLANSHALDNQAWETKILQSDLVILIYDAEDKDTYFKAKNTYDKIQDIDKQEAKRKKGFMERQRAINRSIHFIGINQEGLVELDPDENENEDEENLDLSKNRRSVSKKELKGLENLTTRTNSVKRTKSISSSMKGRNKRKEGEKMEEDQITEVNEMVNNILEEWVLGYIQSEQD